MIMNRSCRAKVSFADCVLTMAIPRGDVDPASTVCSASSPCQQRLKAHQLNVLAMPTASSRSAVRPVVFERCESHCRPKSRNLGVAHSAMSM